MNETLRAKLKQRLQEPGLVVAPGVFDKVHPARAARRCMTLPTSPSSWALKMSGHLKNDTLKPNNSLNNLNKHQETTS
jgi:hypothetical protein